MSSQMRLPSWVIPICVLAALALILKNLQGADAPTAENTIGERFARFDSALVPVGGIVAYVSQAQLPGNWVVCDGSALPAAPKTNPELFAALNGRTPDLTSRVLRGGSKALELGGSDTLPELETLSDGAHSHTLDHSHSLPSKTSLVSSDPAGSTQPMALKNENENEWLRESHWNKVDGGRVGDEGQHRHDLGGSTGSTSFDRNRVAQGSSHSHKIRAGTSITPSYASVKWIIRIR